jgi:hypothetical protein
LDFIVFSTRERESAAKQTSRSDEMNPISILLFVRACFRRPYSTPPSTASTRWHPAQSAARVWSSCTWSTDRAAAKWMGWERGRCEREKRRESERAVLSLWARECESIIRQGSHVKACGIHGETGEECRADMQQGAQRNSGGARGEQNRKTISNHRRVGCWYEITRQHESKDKAAKAKKGVIKRTGA